MTLPRVHPRGVAVGDDGGGAIRTHFGKLIPLLAGGQELRECQPPEEGHAQSRPAVVAVERVNRHDIRVLELRELLRFGRFADCYLEGDQPIRQANLPR